LPAGKLENITGSPRENWKYPSAFKVAPKISTLSFSEIREEWRAPVKRREAWVFAHDMYNDNIIILIQVSAGAISSN
jgi:hypothetical protein